MSERQRQDNEEDPLVRLSVSGTPYTLRREVLVENDWILSRIVDSDIPWKTFDQGRYYVDADPIAFRWALYFVRTRSLPNELTRAELESIQSLADFLCFDSLLGYVRSFRAADIVAATKSDVAKTKRDLSDDIEVLTKRVKELDEKIENQTRMIGRLDCY